MPNRCCPSVRGWKLQTFIPHVGQKYPASVALVSQPNGNRRETNLTPCLAREIFQIIYAKPQRLGRDEMSHKASLCASSSVTDDGGVHSRELHVEPREAAVTVASKHSHHRRNLRLLKHRANHSKRDGAVEKHVSSLGHVGSNLNRADEGRSEASSRCRFLEKSGCLGALSALLPPLSRSRPDPSRPTIAMRIPGTMSPSKSRSPPTPIDTRSTAPARPKADARTGKRTTRPSRHSNPVPFSQTVTSSQP